MRGEEKHYHHVDITYLAPVSLSFMLDEEQAGLLQNGLIDEDTAKYIEKTFKDNLHEVSGEVADYLNYVPLFLKDLSFILEDGSDDSREIDLKVHAKLLVGDHVWPGFVEVISFGCDFLNK